MANRRVWTGRDHQYMITPQTSEKAGMDSYLNIQSTKLPASEGILQSLNAPNSLPNDAHTMIV